MQADTSTERLAVMANFDPNAMLRGAQLTVVGGQSISQLGATDVADVVKPIVPCRILVYLLQIITGRLLSQSALVLLSDW